MNVSRLVSVVLFVAVLAAATGVTRAQEKEKSATTAEAAAPHGDAKAAESHDAEQEPDRNPMAFDPDLAVFSAVIFLLLIGILGKFAWPPIAAALDERERKIAENIAAAAAKLEDAKRIMAEHEAKLAATAGEVRAMLEEARRDADHTKRQIEAEGHKAAKDELDRAVREIGRARDAAIQELAISSANVAVDLARDVVRDQISSDRQQQIVRDALSKLGTANPSSN